MHDILGSLVRYAETQIGIVHGYRFQNITAEIVLNPDGSIYSVNRLGDPKRGQAMLTPIIPVGRTSGVTSGCYCDNHKYLIASGKHHDAAAIAHQAVPDHVHGADAVRAMLRRSHEVSFDAAGEGYLVIRLVGETDYLHDHPTFRDWWTSLGDHALWASGGSSPDDVYGTCSITGKSHQLIARLHASIKGVPKTSPLASLIGVNTSSGEAYGFQQGLVSSVSQSAMLAYTAAMNHLLADDRHCVRFDGLAWAWWSDIVTPTTELMASLLGGDQKADQSVIDAARATMRSLVTTDTPKLSSGSMYLIGLQGRQGRITVLGMHGGDDIDVMRQIVQHSDDIGDATVSLRDMTKAAVPLGSDYVPPITNLVDAVMSGGSYPVTIVRQAIDQHVRDIYDNRINAKGKSKEILRNQRNRARIGLFHGYVAREGRKDGKMMDVCQTARLVGQYMAMVDYVAENAIKRKVNALQTGLRTPTKAIAVLRSETEHRLPKLGLNRIRCLRAIQAIASQLTQVPDRWATPAEQASYILGYDAQMADNYATKTLTETATN